MRRHYGSSRGRLGPAAWLGFFSAACLAAESAAPAVTGRTLETLPTLTWWLAVGYSFGGWVIANLKTLVIAMNGPDKLVAGAEVFSKFVASMLVGVSLCLYLITEARYDGRPIPVLVALFAATIGAFGGMAFINISVEALKSIALKWAQRNGGTNGT